VKLLRLTLKDFRQFYGTQELEFASGREDNVTVVYGANGAGKTTLLNAFTWVLYDKLTPDFEQPDRIVNGYVMADTAEGRGFRSGHSRVRTRAQSLPLAARGGGTSRP
jgi:DNA sulfur modification protein DndD